MALVTKSVRPTTKYMIEVPFGKGLLGKPRYMDKKAKPSEVKGHAISYAIANDCFSYGAHISKRVGNVWVDVGEILNISKDDFSADFFDPSNGTRTRINFLGHKI